jgi:hypothetical protein
MAVPQVLGGVRAALEASGFRVRLHEGDHRYGRLRAVWGGKAKAWLVGHLPFGKLVKSGKRLGAEVEVADTPQGGSLRLGIVPYMELFDRPEVLLLSQGIFEKVTDDSFAQGKFNEVMSRMASMGLVPGARPLPPGPPAGYYPGPPAYGPPAYAPAPYPSAAHRPPARRGGSTGLALLTGVGLTTLILLGRITLDPNILWPVVAIGVPLLAGFIAGRIGRGAFSGFISLFLPFIAVAVYILSFASEATDSSSPFIGLAIAIAGIILIALAIGLGIVGLLFGAIGGGIGSVVLKRPPKAQP